MKSLRVLVVVGTRPEVVKMAPVVFALRRSPGMRVELCASAQHRQLLDAMLRDFGLRADHDLDVMRPGQSPTGVLARVAEGTDALLSRKPFDLALVQGDTTTVLAASLAAFHRRVPVGHVEAGLRSFDLASPFPEEGNRLAADVLAELLFAPTRAAKRHLLDEDARGEIFVTGNTSVDALLWAASREHRFREPALRRLPSGPLAVVTLHRRESFGAPLDGMLRSLERAARERPEMLWVYPVHPNPRVRAAARRWLKSPRILKVPPLGYLDFVHLMRLSRLIITDSGGIQEEAPSLGKPVLVMRDKTERVEALRGGLTRLVGASGHKLLAALRRPPQPRVPRANPFGDGRAAQRIAQAIAWWAGRGRRPADFV